MLIRSLIRLVNELVITIYMPPNLSAHTALSIEQSGSLLCKFVLQAALKLRHTHTHITIVFKSNTSQVRRT